MYMSAYVPHFSSSGDVQAWDLFVLLTGLLFGFSEVASSFSVEFVTLHFSLALIYNTSTGYQNQILTFFMTSIFQQQLESSVQNLNFLFESIRLVQD